MDHCRFDKPFATGIIFALTLHLPVLYYMVLPALLPRSVVPAPTEVLFEVDLTVALKPPAPPAEPDKIAHEEVNEAARSDRPAQPSTTPPIQSAPAPEIVAPLDLTRPKDWRAFDEDSAQQHSTLQAMRPKFAEALAATQRAQGRRVLLENRGIAVNGLSVAAYNALEGSTSNHVKTEAGCFDLRPSTAGDVIATSGVEHRWWRTACKDLFVNPFEQPVLEYDNTARAVGQAAGR